MQEKFLILIAERNRNIREFLERELTAEGYLVLLANNGQEVLKRICLEHPDLLILDMDMPYLDGFEILEQLQNEKQSIPVIVHSLPTVFENQPATRNIAAYVEKNGHSINGLKTSITEVLCKYYPQKWDVVINHNIER